MSCSIRRRTGYSLESDGFRNKAAGSLWYAWQDSGTGGYLANMVLYPSRFEFFEYLPENIQVRQPLGILASLRTYPTHLIVCYLPERHLASAAPSVVPQYQVHVERWCMVKL